jgi:hypothetical protein
VISKEERERDLAICDAATPEWRQGHHVGEPLALCAAATPDESLLGLDKDDMAIFWRAEDAAAAVNCRNRLPAYIADAAEMERRIEAVAGIASELRLRVASGVYDGDVGEGALFLAGIIERAERILRGER